MRPAAFAVFSMLAVAALSYRHYSGKQWALRDAPNDSGFRMDVKQALENSGNFSVAPAVKGAPVETLLKVFDSPSLANIQKAIANLKEAEKLALNNQRDGSSYPALIEGAQEALQDRQVRIARSFGAKIYCGGVLQFRQGDERANSCDFREGDICYQGDAGQARDLIMAAAARGYWSGGDENEIKAWIYQGMLLLNVRNEGQHEAKRQIVPCR